MSSKFGALEEWRTAGENVVFLNLALHQPRNLQRVISIQRPLVSTLLDLVSTHCPKLAQKHCVDTSKGCVDTTLAKLHILGLIIT
ncbi:hypothetical protein Taro_033075 [Colocasia esculenta]|uniref:Uncharacterized protein n=1 Tax=Colocasia esculenta TaxID=4460 RepID=A0A843W5V5_COLES|nr:hypothetical protein [Colocasia esculenta]